MSVMLLPLYWWFPAHQGTHLVSGKESYHETQGIFLEKIPNLGTALAGPWLGILGPNGKLDAVAPLKLDPSPATSTTLNKKINNDHKKTRRGGPVDNRPPPTSSTTLSIFVKEKKEEKICRIFIFYFLFFNVKINILTCDSWQLTCDTWHMTHDA